MNDYKPDSPVRVADCPCSHGVSNEVPEVASAVGPAESVRDASRLLLVAAAVLSVGACDIGASLFDRRPAGSVEVHPSDVLLGSGRDRRLVAAVFDTTGALLADRSVRWSSADPAVATVDRRGIIRGVRPGETVVTATAGEVNATSSVRVFAAAPAAGDIVIDSTVAHQAIRGWEVTAWMNQWGCPEGAFNTELLERYRDAVMDSARALGITRIRLEVRAGAERPDDHFTRFRAREIDYSVYKTTYYDAINDNADPFQIDPAGFHFSEMDFTVDQVVEPFRRSVLAAGDTPFVSLNFVDFRRRSFEHRQAPEEYAEFMLATFLHLQERYGWVPNAVEVILEPDNGPRGWTPEEVGLTLAAAGRRLEGAGFTPDFVAPSTMVMGQAVRYLDAMMAIEGVRQFLSEISYHRYGASSRDDLELIGLRTIQYGVPSAMLEKIGSGYEELHADLALGRASAWQQYTLSGCTISNDGDRLFGVDITDPSNPRVRAAGRTQFLGQYFRYIRPGAYRIETTSSIDGLDPLAFINPDGGRVVVIKAAGERSFDIGGLPPGRYGVTYTIGRDAKTPSESGVVATDVIVGRDGLAALDMPGAGVITVFRRTALSAPSHE